MKAVLSLVALSAPGTAFAADALALSSTVFVEKSVTDARGRATIVLETPKVVAPGDRLVFLLSYRNTGMRPTSNFVVTNPMPQAVAYQGTPDRDALVSIDGGRKWGRIGELRVVERDGSVRGARPEDVTHVRWAMKDAIPVGYSGKLTFRGIVR